MTNEEAIKILKNYHNGYFGYKIDDVHEAHNLAIKALEFTESQRICCDNCVNRNIKSKEACISPFGECEFFNATPDRSLEVARKSIELGRSLGRTEERVESKRPQGKWFDYVEDSLLKARHGKYVLYKDDYLLDNLAREIALLESVRRMRGGAE